MSSSLNLVGSLFLGLDTIAGGSGTMWTTALQIGELVETAQLVCSH